MNGGRWSRAVDRSRKRRRGVTLRELLVVMAIITVLLLLVSPAIAYGRSLARDAACKAHLKRLWIATAYYANSYRGYLFVNHAPPLRISNVIHKNGRPTGWGALYPVFLNDYYAFFCPSDPGRGPAWEYGWSNWRSPHGEVRCSYGYRGRQGLAPTALVPLTVSHLERSPRKVIGCDFYEPFFAPPRVHHDGYINVLRGSGGVDQVDQILSFGPGEQDFQTALDALDR